MKENSKNAAQLLLLLLCLRTLENACCGLLLGVFTVLVSRTLLKFAEMRVRCKLLIKNCIATHLHIHKILKNQFLKYSFAIQLLDVPQLFTK